PGGVDNRYALFLIDEIGLTERLTLTVALRYEHSNIDADPFTPPGPPGAPPGPPVSVDVDNDATMGGASLRYAFDNGFSIFGSLARTESLPIIDDAENQQFIRQSEIGDTAELGFAYSGFDLFTDGDALAFKLNYYDTELEDVTSYSGIDEITISGIEVEASLAFEMGTYFDFNGAFIVDSDAILIETGETVEFDRAPVDNFRLTIGQRFGTSVDLSYEAIVSLEDDRVSPLTEVPGDSFTVHNLRLTWFPQANFLNDAFVSNTQIRFGVENLTDEQYQPLLSTRPAPGRNFKLTASTMF
ncbi:MAG: TonB-dependent receptor, partial [Pseudomonadota bacterium]